MSLTDADPNRHTAQDFQHLLLNVWGFHKTKNEGQRSVFRGPRGGTLRINNSMSGAADPQQVEKAAGLLGITVEKFWGEPSTPRQTAPLSTVTRIGGNSDSYVAMVLSVHTTEDRPLSFDQVMKIAAKMGYKITRDQVAGASAGLCLDGDLVRTRRGVYQWSGGKRVNRGRGDHVVDIKVTQDDAQPASPYVAKPIINIEAQPSATTSVDDVFEVAFPNGVKMEKLSDMADLDEWRRLTAKFLGLTI